MLRTFIYTEVHKKSIKKINKQTNTYTFTFVTLNYEVRLTLQNIQLKLTSHFTFPKPVLFS